MGLALYRGMRLGLIFIFLVCLSGLAEDPPTDFSQFYFKLEVAVPPPLPIEKLGPKIHAVTDPLVNGAERVSRVAGEAEKRVLSAEEKLEEIFKWDDWLKTHMPENPQDLQVILEKLKARDPDIAKGVAALVGKQLMKGSVNEIKSKFDYLEKVRAALGATKNGAKLFASTLEKGASLEDVTLDRLYAIRAELDKALEDEEKPLNRVGARFKASFQRAVAMAKEAKADTASILASGKQDIQELVFNLAELGASHPGVESALQIATTLSNSGTIDPAALDQLKKDFAGTTVVQSLEKIQSQYHQLEAKAEGAARVVQDPSQLLRR